ncbi:hypothetical protein JAN5088_01726 [Jannaschia rubra]|uniref:Uncharacterized protein n=1 Tax=Jannaschia rubra TaxID=282197 RepID=A0A0M6XQK1_9RHOB|nr:hypothetical protein JAN5088_01726 [Jannaschia rubra]SFG60319.1 hypothetical protein SAMN04488517_107103 [Jannaschia rubra]
MGPRPMPNGGRLRAGTWPSRSGSTGASPTPLPAMDGPDLRRRQGVEKSGTGQSRPPASAGLRRTPSSAGAADRTASRSSGGPEWPRRCRPAAALAPRRRVPRRRRIEPDSQRSAFTQRDVTGGPDRRTGSGCGSGSAQARTCDPAMTPDSQCESRTGFGQQGRENRRPWCPGDGHACARYHKADLQLRDLPWRKVHEPGRRGRAGVDHNLQAAKSITLRCRNQDIAEADPTCRNPADDSGSALISSCS